jgi:hypothetical protein
MLKDSEIGNIAAVGPVGDPPASKYERLIARAKQVNPAITVVVHPCEETALRGPIQAAEAGIIKPILVGPAAKIAAVALPTKLARGAMLVRLMSIPPVRVCSKLASCSPNTPSG